MTPAQIHAECKSIAATFGKDAEVSVRIATYSRSGEAIVMATCWPRGMSEHEAHHGEAPTFEEAFALLRAKLEGVRASHAAKVTRAMALEIIQQTFDHGECTDAALRAKFSAAEVADYGPAAVEQANALSDNRPFAIVETRGANAA